MYQRHDFGMPPAGGGGAAAALTAPTMFPRFGPIDARPRPRFELAVDLGADIGAWRWWRGLVTLAAMVAALAHVAPAPLRIAPSPAPFGPVLAPAERAELRAIGIAPVADGADSGERLAPGARALPLATTPERPRIDLQLVLRGGDGLARALVRAGADPGDAARAATLVAAAAPALADGTRVTVTLGPRAGAGTARPIARAALRATLGLAVTLRRTGAGLVLDRTPIAVDDTPLRVSAPIGESLYHALRGAGVPLPVLADYLKAIAAHVSLDEIAPGDDFELVMAHRRAATGESEPGRLLYAGLGHGGERLRLLRWTVAGREGWFDASGAGARREGLSLPVNGRLTSGFGMRFHPILGYSRMHQGIDLAAPAGTPIVAASDGVVSFAGWHGGHGNYVRVAHSGGMATGYGHMMRFTVGAGQSVRQGQLIGYVGSTGLSTGPHCHFEVFRNGVAIDPTGAHLASGTRIAAPDLTRFRATLARYETLPLG